MAAIKEDADLSHFTIDALLDALWTIRVGKLDSPEWVEKKAKVRDVIVKELESRSTKDLVDALIRESIKSLD